RAACWATCSFRSTPFSCKHWGRAPFFLAEEPPDVRLAGDTSYPAGAPARPPGPASLGRVRRAVRPAPVRLRPPPPAPGGGRGGRHAGSPHRRDGREVSTAQGALPEVARDRPAEPDPRLPRGAPAPRRGLRRHRGQRALAGGTVP